MQFSLVNGVAELRPVCGPKEGTERIAELDALRGIGAITILGFHLWPSTFFFGWTRADLFFVISGFVITRIIMRYELSWRFLFRFWARRALRVWPVYYLLTAILCSSAICRQQTLRLDELLAHLTFTQFLPCYWSDATPKLLGGTAHTWSLAVEEQFYLAWPLIILLVGRSFVIPLAFWLLFNSVAARLFGFFPYIALARCDGLALGAILAAIFAAPTSPKSLAGPWLSLALSLVGLTGLVILIIKRDAFFLPRSNLASGCGPWGILAVNLIYFSSMGLMIRHSGHRWLGLLRIRPLQYMGQISYGIYLYSLFIFEEVGLYLGDSSIATDLTAALTTILVAALSWEFLECPLASLKSLLPYYERSKHEIISGEAVMERQAVVIGLDKGDSRSPIKGDCTISHEPNSTCSR